MPDNYQKMTPRETKMLNMYKNGHTLEEIGSEYRITRERARQIIRKAASIELAQQYGMDSNDKDIRKSLDGQVDFLLRQILIARKENKLEEELSGINKLIDEGFIKGIKPENFFSLHMYSKCIGIKENELKELRLDIVEIIQNNKRKRWSWYYAQCRSCGTTGIKHRSLGYCKICYPKSPESRERQMDSYYRNTESRKKYNKKYIGDYNKRENIKERLRKRNDIINFGGNREIAIERDGFKCTQCGLTRESSEEKYKKDLFVYHKDKNRDNNKLDNLVTLCYSCFQRTAQNFFGK